MSPVVMMGPGVRTDTWTKEVLHFLHNFFIPWHYRLWNYISITEARISVLTQKRIYWGPWFFPVTISTHRKHSKMSNTPPASTHRITKTTTAWYFQKILSEQWKLQVLRADSVWRAQVPSLPYLQNTTAHLEVIRRKASAGFLWPFCRPEKDAVSQIPPSAQTPIAQNGTWMQNQGHHSRFGCTVVYLHALCRPSHAHLDATK